MGKIVAIGGGEIGKPGYPVETTEIDIEIIRLSGKTNPSLLFIPTATSDSARYCQLIRDHFGAKLGCRIDVLYLVKEKPGLREIENKILSSDIVYVGGGNTLRMMKSWRKNGVGSILGEAHRRGIVLSGLSAGAICWFKYGSSDSMKFKKPEAGLIRVRGLGFFNAVFCPHYDVEEDRKPHFRELMLKVSEVGIALDNCCALEIVDDKWRIITSRSTANAYRVYRDKGRIYEDILEKKQEYMPMEVLLAK